MTHASNRTRRCSARPAQRGVGPGLVYKPRNVTRTADAAKRCHSEAALKRLADCHKTSAQKYTLNYAPTGRKLDAGSALAVVHGAMCDLLRPTRSTPTLKDEAPESHILLDPRFDCDDA